jgi:hypothetical protein
MKLNRKGLILIVFSQDNNGMVTVYDSSYRKERKVLGFLLVPNAMRYITTLKGEARERWITTNLRTA